MLLCAVVGSNWAWAAQGERGGGGDTGGEQRAGCSVAALVPQLDECACITAVAQMESKDERGLHEAPSGNWAVSLRLVQPLRTLPIPAGYQ